MSILVTLKPESVYDRIIVGGKTITTGEAVRFDSVKDIPSMFHTDIIVTKTKPVKGKK